MKQSSWGVVHRLDRQAFGKHDLLVAVLLVAGALWWWLL